MLVFIDDSGDPGFKLDKGSSRFFVIALVIFDDELEAEKTSVAIKELKRSLNFPADVEFKFHKSSKVTTLKFLEKINSFNFRVRALVVDKNLIKSDELKNSRNSFYSYIIKMALKYTNHRILNARVRIDGSGDRTFRKSFLTYLRKELNTSEKKIMKNCKLVNSRGNSLIQMADMIAGSIRRSYEIEKTDADIYREIVKKHIEDEWKFR